MGERELERKELTLQPVGVVRSDVELLVPGVDTVEMDPDERLKEIRKRHKKMKESVSELHINPELDGILEGIEDFSHVVVLFWPDRIPAERHEMRQVHPMGRKDLPLKGIFATRSPARPNPVLVSTVRLLSKEGNVLRVQGLDALDGSPIIDVKPYVPNFHEVENVADVRLPEWIQQLFRDVEKGGEGEVASDPA